MLHNLTPLEHRVVRSERVVQGWMWKLRVSSVSTVRTRLSMFELCMLHFEDCRGLHASANRHNAKLCIPSGRFHSSFLCGSPESHGVEGQFQCSVDKRLTDQHLVPAPDSEGPQRGLAPGATTTASVLETA
eukprot:3618744-Rhodomonas_salina.1